MPQYVIVPVHNMSSHRFRVNSLTAATADRDRSVTPAEIGALFPCCRATRHATRRGVGAQVSPASGSSSAARRAGDHIWRASEGPKLLCHPRPRLPINPAPADSVPSQSTRTNLNHFCLEQPHVYQAIFGIFMQVEEQEDGDEMLEGRLVTTCVRTTRQQRWGSMECWPVWNLAVKCQHWLSCPRSVSDGDVAVSKKEIAWTRPVHVLGCVCRHKRAVSLLSNCSVCSTAGRNNTHGNCFHILMQYHILTKSYWCYKFILYLIF
jgi:hypothetical protein